MLSLMAPGILLTRLTASCWDEQLSRFAGPDPRRIHHLPRDRELLLELPQSVQVLHITSSKGLF
jgi:hypothetical protein